MADFAAILHATPPADPAQPVRMPGEIELDNLERQRREGIEIDAARAREAQGIRRAPHSIVMFALRTTSRQRACSFAMKAPNCSGVPIPATALSAA